MSYTKTVVYCEKRVLSPSRSVLKNIAAAIYGGVVTKRDHFVFNPGDVFCITFFVSKHGNMLNILVYQRHLGTEFCVLMALK